MEEGGDALRRRDLAEIAERRWCARPGSRFGDRVERVPDHVQPGPNPRQATVLVSDGIGDGDHDIGRMAGDSEIAERRDRDAGPAPSIARRSIAFHERCPLAEQPVVMKRVDVRDPEP